MSQRVNELASVHIDKMWKESKTPLPIALRQKVEQVWGRHAGYAAAILNDTLANNHFWSSGFEYDQQTNVALLVTGTSHPFEQFVVRLYQNHDGSRSGMGYIANLGGLIAEKEIFQSPFTEFHHWILSGGTHGCWLTCAIGARVAGTTEVDFVVPPVPVLNEHELCAIAFAGHAAVSDSDGQILARDPKNHLASHWGCDSCHRVFEKRSPNPRQCPNCSVATSPDEIQSGCHDVYEIYEDDRVIDHLTYSSLRRVTWWFMRRPKAEDIGALRRPMFFGKERLREEMMKQFNESKRVIYTLDTRSSGGAPAVVPGPGLLYSASLSRVTFTYSKANNTSLVDAQRAIIGAVGGYSAYQQRMVEDFLREEREKKTT